jgi:nitric oxide reductase NorD protein
MTSLDIEPWEPEESVGKIWHVFASKLAPSQEHDGARVDLAEMRGRLSVLFRGLVGNPAVDLKPVAP